MRAQKTSLFAAFQGLKEMMSGASIRSVAGITGTGEVLVATVGDDGSDTHSVHDKNHDIWTRFTDVLSGLSEMGRLYAPAGILWRLTPKGQGAHVLRGRKMRGPGASLVIPDGGDGKSSVVPSWLSTSLSGVSLPEGFEIESTGDQVKIVANSGGTSASVTLNKDGSIDLTPASGKTVNVAGTAYSLLKTEDFFTDLAAFIGAVIADLASAAAAPASAYTASVNTTDLFAKAVTATGVPYKSTKAKNG